MTVPGGGASFWAERLRDAHPVPYRYLDKIEVPSPDDMATAALDDCVTAVEEIEALAGESLADTLLDAIDDAGDLPATVSDGLLRHYHLDRPPESGWHEMVERINVYGAAIEYDLDSGPYRYGLHDYFIGVVPGGWDHLVRMLNRMPMGSHFRAAVSDDDELARAMVETHGPLHKRKGSSRPPLTEFDRQVMYLHVISNKLTYLAWAVFAAQAGKKKGTPPKGDKGPETADERIDFQDFLAEHEEVVAQVLKDKGGTKARVERRPPDEAVRGAVLLPRAIGSDDPDDDQQTDRKG
jgi:hypothetical protein